MPCTKPQTPKLTDVNHPPVLDTRDAHPRVINRYPILPHLPRHTASVIIYRAPKHVLSPIPRGSAQGSPPAARTALTADFLQHDGIPTRHTTPPWNFRYALMVVRMEYGNIGKCHVCKRRGVFLEVLETRGSVRFWKIGNTYGR